MTGVAHSGWSRPTRSAWSCSFLWASHPAAAAGDELRVVAVHTASAPRVSMVVAPPSTAPEDGSEEESCSVTIDGEPVATTVGPMASGNLSVALVIDTASGLTSQELAAVQNGATEFLLRLPGGAYTIVVTAGGQPKVVAPLGGHRAEALSAINALRVGGSRATMPATMLAAESLESAPPGPRAIIVYTHGPDEQGMLPDRLSQAVLNLRSCRQRYTDRHRCPLAIRRRASGRRRRDDQCRAHRAVLRRLGRAG